MGLYVAREAFGMGSAWVQNGVEVLMDAIRRGRPSYFMSVRIWLKRDFDTLYADKQKVKRSGRLDLAPFCSKWAAKRFSAVACPSACATMRLEDQVESQHV